MRAYVCVYRHRQPSPREWQLAEEAAQGNPLLSRYLAHYDASRSVDDWGRRPELLLRAGRTWFGQPGDLGGLPSRRPQPHEARRLRRLLLRQGDRCWDGAAWTAWALTAASLPPDGQSLIAREQGIGSICAHALVRMRRTAAVRQLPTSPPRNRLEESASCLRRWSSTLPCLIRLHSLWFSTATLAAAGYW